MEGRTERRKDGMPNTMSPLFSSKRRGGGGAIRKLNFTKLILIIFSLLYQRPLSLCCIHEPARKTLGLIV